MAQRKETKVTIKVRDLKPKKDAKGGVVQNVSTKSAPRRDSRIIAALIAGLTRSRSAPLRIKYSSVADAIKRQTNPKLGKEKMAQPP